MISSSPRAFSSATTLRPMNPAAPVTMIGLAIRRNRSSDDAIAASISTSRSRKQIPFGNTKERDAHPLLSFPKGICFYKRSTSHLPRVQHLPRNHDPLHLTRPLANRAQLHIAIEL